MNKILITGSSGFIGSALVKSLIKDSQIGSLIGVSRRNSCFPYPIRDSESIHYEEFYCDLTDSERVKHLMECVKPDVIFHLAGIPVVKKDDANPFVISHTNTMSTHYLLEYAPKGCVFVFASTIIIYGNREYPAHESDRCRLASVYAATKLASEHLIETYHKQGNVVGRTLRLCATVGPTNLTHGVLRDIVVKLRSDNPNLELLGDYPGSCKPYCHVDDVVQAMELTAFNVDCTNYFAANIVPNNSITIETLAHVVMDAIGIVKPIKWLGEAANWKGDNRRLLADNELAKWRLNWKPLYNLSEEAVRAAVVTMREHCV